MPDRVKPAELKRFLAQSPRAEGRRSLTQWNDRWRKRQAAADAEQRRSPK